MARKSIGYGHVDAAVGSLTLTAQKTVGLTTHYGITREGTLPMLFRDDDLVKLQQVHGMVETDTDTKAYPIWDGAILFINYEGAKVPAIQPSQLAINTPRFAPLLRHVAEVKAVHDRFEEVKGVLRWLNRNATPGAIRYYWPTAMKLCPHAAIWRDLQEVPSRYSNPPQIGDWTQALKDAATTVAGSLMLPNDAKPKPQGAMWLTFVKRVVKLADNSSYTTDQVTYNI